MPLPVFPTLSSAGLSVRYTESVYEDPSIMTEFENGWEEVRSRRSVGRYRSLKVVYTVNATDAATIISFLQARRFQRDPFQYTHPLAGTVTVRYASDDFNIKTIVQGRTAYWYEIELDLRVLYGSTF